LTLQRRHPLVRRTDLKARLWARMRLLEGAHFRKDAPFKSFTLDFVDHTAGLVISLEDGEPGKNKFAIHTVRDRLLGEQGYAILRLWRVEAEQDTAAAIQRIRAVMDDLSPPHSR
jgi:very-short-patch-repair endonuclease